MDVRIILTIQLTDKTSAPAKLHRLAGEMAMSLRGQPGIEANLVELPSGLGDRGDAVLIGQIAVQLASAGGVLVSLVNVLKSYIERGRTLEIEFKRGDGSAMAIKTANLRPDELESLLLRVEKFLKPGASL